MSTSVTPPGSDTAPKGYLHIAAAVEPTLGRTPKPRNSARKSALLRQLSALTAQASADTGTRAAVFAARLIPPRVGMEDRRTPSSARCDVAVLFELDAVDGLERLQAHPAVTSVIRAVTAQSCETLVLPARCVATIADVDRTRPGLFLFNYFTGPDPSTTLDAWLRVAEWYQRKTGLDNSTLLAPVDASPITLVNHARWDISLPVLAVRQFLRPSFRRDVIDVLRNAHVQSQPIFFDLVATTERTRTRVPYTGAP